MTTTPGRLLALDLDGMLQRGRLAARAGEGGATAEVIEEPLDGNAKA